MPWKRDRMATMEAYARGPWRGGGQAGPMVPMLDGVEECFKYRSGAPQSEGIPDEGFEDWCRHGKELREACTCCCPGEYGSPVGPMLATGGLHLREGSHVLFEGSGEVTDRTRDLRPSDGQYCSMPVAVRTVENRGHGGVFEQREVVGSRADDGWPEKRGISDGGQEGATPLHLRRDVGAEGVENVCLESHAAVSRGGRYHVRTSRANRRWSSACVAASRGLPRGGRGRHALKPAHSCAK